jgi:hypothetical protein
MSDDAQDFAALPLPARARALLAVGLVDAQWVADVRGVLLDLARACEAVPAGQLGVQAALAETRAIMAAGDPRDDAAGWAAFAALLTVLDGAPAARGEAWR